MGHPSGAPKMHQKMTDKRRMKLQALGRSLPLPEVFGPDEGNVLLVGWGSTQGSLREATQKAREAGDSVSSMTLRHIHPLPEGLENIFDGFHHVFVVENNDEGLYGYGQLAALLRAKFCDPKIKGINKTDGLTWRVKDVLARVKSKLEEK
jgi:2-oxoglutarate ferredoxin oxidoreductase subunit alpha